MQKERKKEWRERKGLAWLASVREEQRSVIVDRTRLGSGQVVSMITSQTDPGLSVTGW